MEELEKFMDTITTRQEGPLYHYWDIDLGRNRILNVSTSAFDMMVVLMGGINNKGITDTIVLFNRDYDGLLTSDKVEEIFHAITNRSLVDYITTDRI